jgi:hypothetical protein
MIVAAGHLFRTVREVGHQHEVNNIQMRMVDLAQTKLPFFI